MTNLTQEEIEVLVDSEYEDHMKGEFERVHPTSDARYNQFYENSAFDLVLEKYYKQ